MSAVVDDDVEAAGCCSGDLAQERRVALVPEVQCATKRSSERGGYLPPLGTILHWKFCSVVNDDELGGWEHLLPLRSARKKP